MRRLWTKRDEQRLRELYGQARVTDLAYELSRSERAIICKASKLGVARKPHWTDDELRGLAQGEWLPRRNWQARKCKLYRRRR